MQGATLEHVMPSTLASDTKTRLSRDAPTCSCLTLWTPTVGLYGGRVNTVSCQVHVERHVSCSVPSACVLCVVQCVVCVCQYTDRSKASDTVRLVCVYTHVCANMCTEHHRHNTARCISAHCAPSTFPIPSRTRVHVHTYAHALDRQGRKDLQNGGP